MSIEKISELKVLADLLPGYKGTVPLRTKIKKALRFCNTYKCDIGTSNKIAAECQAAYDKQAGFCQAEAQRREVK